MGAVPGADRANVAPISRASARHWEQLSHVNPRFYVVETIRYGFLGVSDVSPWIAFAVVAGMCLALLAWSQWLFTSGRKLKP
jgi:ABC-2 type transport system permease protein